MFKNGRELEDVESVEADVCIIGAGPAGMTLAAELTKGGLHVVMLESGGDRMDDKTKALAAGDNVGRDYFKLDRARVRQFGGSTARWAGLCRPFEPMDFEEREWVPNSGWPMTREQLDPYYKRAQKMMRLGPYAYEPDEWITEELPKPRVKKSSSVRFFRFTCRRMRLQS